MEMETTINSSSVAPDDEAGCFTNFIVITSTRGQLFCREMSYLEVDTRISDSRESPDNVSV